MVGSLCKFKTVHGALHWFDGHNPARSRTCNIIEPEKSAKPSFSQFSGEHPHDIWSAICLAIQKVLADYDSRATQIFNSHFRGDSESQLSKEDIARKFNYTNRHVNRIIRQVTNDLEDELIRRGLLEPPSELMKQLR